MKYTYYYSFQLPCAAFLYPLLVDKLDSPSLKKNIRFIFLLLMESYCFLYHYIYINSFYLRSSICTSAVSPPPTVPKIIFPRCNRPSSEQQFVEFVIHHSFQKRYVLLPYLLLLVSHHFARHCPFPSLPLHPLYPCTLPCHPYRPPKNGTESVFIMKQGTF